MQMSARSVVMSGAAVLTATAVAITPVQALPHDVAVPSAAVAAERQQSQQLVELLAAIQRYTPSSAGPLAVAAAPQPQAQPNLLAFPGLGNAIIGAYNAIEPWVAYGVDVADWALGWIPFGWVVGDQINIFYDSFEPAVRAIFYNLGGWIGGSISFGAGLNNVVLAGANSVINLINNEISYGFGFLPPLPFPPPQIPNLPWFGVLQTQATSGLVAEATPSATVGDRLTAFVDRIFAPTPDSVDNDFRPRLSGRDAQLDGTTEVSSVPAIVKESLAPQNRFDVPGRLSNVADAVRNLGTDVTSSVGSPRAKASDVGNEVVRGQAPGGAVGKAVTEAVSALRGGKPNKDADGATTASSVAKTIGDTARQAVKKVRQAADDARNAAKDGPASNSEKE
jgi:hypothetical protein